MDYRKKTEGDYEEQAEMLLKALGKEMAVQTAFSVDAFCVQRKDVPVRKRPFFLGLRKTVAMVIVVCLLLTGFSTEVRAAVVRAFHYVIEVFTEYDRISPETPSKTDTGWQPSYEVGWLPEGYTLVFDKENVSLSLTKVYGNGDSYIDFVQSDPARYTISIDNEHSVHVTTQIQGCEAHVYYWLPEGAEDRPDTVCGNILVIWENEDTTLELNCTYLSREDALKIAESVRKKEAGE